MRMANLAGVIVMCAAAWARADFDAILRGVVDDKGWVNYAALKVDAVALDAEVSSLAGRNFAAMTDEDQLANLINAYNACTMKLIVENYPLKSIRDIPDEQRWKAARWNLGGRVVSLDQIENELIRGTFNEPRVHFALVCAAKGCPPLRAEAYAGEKIEAQLSDQIRRTHGTDTPWVKFDAEKNTLAITSLYDWFAGDFLKRSPSVLEFVAAAVPELRASIDAGKSPAVSYLDYDWSLNDASK